MYTKVGTAKFFQDLGFYEIARVEDTLSFLENRKNGFARFCARLAQRRTEEPAAAIVMNANPFTLGHLALVERAAGEFPAVHLFVLEEDASLVPFAVRWNLVTEGVAHLSNVVCHKSGPYLISSATFPSYFLKDEAAVIQGHAPAGPGSVRPDCQGPESHCPLCREGTLQPGHRIVQPGNGPGTAQEGHPIH